MYVQFAHPIYCFGRIDMLLEIKVQCSCISGVCNCTLRYVTLIEPLDVIGQPKFKDHGLDCSSDFLFKVVDTNQLIALYPTDILQKCIFLRSNGDSFLCPLPCRFYCD